MHNIQIAITGIGIVSPIGVGINEFRKALLNSSPELQKKHILFRNFNAAEYTQSDNIRRMTLGTQLGLIAAEEAVRDANIPLNSANKRNDIYIVYATTHPVISYVETFHKSLLEYGPAGSTPMCFAAGIHNAVPFFVGNRFGITGGATTVIGLSNAGIDATIEGCEILSDNNNINVVIVAASTEVTQLLIKSYEGLFQNDIRKMPMLTEGGACIILERSQDAVSRNARPYALITKWGEIQELLNQPNTEYPLGEGFAYTAVANIITAILRRKATNNADKKVVITSNEIENYRAGVVLEII